jgi:hypothetical protein
VVREGGAIFSSRVLNLGESCLSFFSQQTYDVTSLLVAERLEDRFFQALRRWSGFCFLSQRFSPADYYLPIVFKLASGWNFSQNFLTCFLRTCFTLRESHDAAKEALLTRHVYVAS